MSVFPMSRRRRFRPMRRVPPSMLIREDLDRLLADGAGPGENLISDLVQTVTRLGDPDAGQRGWRNGYVESSIRTAEGKIPIRVPQVRDAAEPFRSTLMGFLEGSSDVLDRLVMEMYARGFASRDFGG